MSGPEEQTGFDAPRPARDGWVARLFEVHGLSDTPSLAEIEPVAKALWGDPATRLTALELVLGREVNANEFIADPLLGQLLTLTDAGLAFGSLLMVREMDQPRDQPS